MLINLILTLSMESSPFHFFPQLEIFYSAYRRVLIASREGIHSSTHVPILLSLSYTHDPRVRHPRGVTVIHCGACPPPYKLLSNFQFLHWPPFLFPPSLPPRTHARFQSILILSKAFFISAFSFASTPTSERSSVLPNQISNPSRRRKKVK